MKKIITTIAFIALSTVSAKAVDLGMFSVTAGYATNSGVYGATGVQTNEDGGAGTFRTNQDSGVFVDGHSSQFIELGLGQYFSVGYEVSPDSISTPSNISNEGGNNSATVSVDFNDLETTYLKLNTPWGLYFKTGSVQVDLDIKETVASGSTYKNTSTEGTMYGAGYQKYIGETGFGLRVEGAYMDLDDVKTDNGQTTVGSNSRLNRVSASNLEGLTAKVALTYTLGRN